MATTTHPFEPAGFFGLRTPLLPADALRLWSEGLRAGDAFRRGEPLEEALQHDRAVLRERLRARIRDPAVQEAIFVASPSLADRLPGWVSEPDGEHGRKVEPALTRYFERMVVRATPFGLCAGCSVGTLGPVTRLLLAPRAAYRRHTRLDSEFLASVLAALLSDGASRRALEFVPNTSLYRLAGRLRYAQRRLRGGERTVHLVSVEATPELEIILRHAARGARLSDLAALVEAIPGVERDEARSFLDEIVDAQLLEPVLAPAVTGPEPIHRILANLEAVPGARDRAERLRDVQRMLEAMDAQGIGQEPDRYRQAAARLEGLAPEIDRAHLFHVELSKPAPGTTLGGMVLDDIVRAVALLHRVAAPPDSDPLARFRMAFTRRYQGQEVPLAEALDSEHGIGFDAAAGAAADTSPLLAGLRFPGTQAESAAWSPRDAFLLGRLTRLLRSGAAVMELEEADLLRLEVRDRPPLPGSFSVLATIAARSHEALQRGEFRVHVRSCSGPSGANLLGRFCHGDEILNRHVQQMLRREEALWPDAVFAEVVHMPEGRIGNVLLRPMLHAREIVYLARSVAPTEDQILLDDLRVSVDGGRVILRSARLGREVIPRLTTAHDFLGPQNLGVYRFLCAVVRQGVAGALSWRWGPLDDAEFLPRVTAGRLTLAAARWRLDEPRLRALTRGSDPQRFCAVQQLRAALRMPRYVALSEGDNMLPIDLDNVLSVEAWLSLLRRRSSATLVEMIDPGDALVEGPEGRFFHELVVAFQAAPAEAQPRRSAAPTRSSDERVLRRFLPGSDWLYLKLFTGTATADRVLSAFAPVIDAALRSGAADRWFFLRYGDPDWHLRVRFHGAASRLHAEVLPAVESAAGELARAGLLHRVELDTYEREVERYGGEEGVELSEQLFFLDSAAVLSMLGDLGGDEGAEARVRLAFVGIDTLLDAFGLGVAQRAALMRRARDDFARELGIDVAFERQLGDRFRRERIVIEGLLAGAAATDPRLAAGASILRRRASAMSAVARDICARSASGRLTAPLAAIALSHVHMHINRLIRSAHRAHELVVYDFLTRVYRGRERRGRRP